MAAYGFPTNWLLRAEGSGDIGTKYCTSTANSTGSPADLSASGSTSSGAGDLTLESSPVPNQPSIFFHGMNQVQNPFGNGFIRTNQNIVLGSVVVGGGTGCGPNCASYTDDNSNAKHSLSGFVGNTRNFQHWFRDPMAGGAAFNTSNALSISIPPCLRRFLFAWMRAPALLTQGPSLCPLWLMFWSGRIWGIRDKNRRATRPWR